MVPTQWLVRFIHRALPLLGFPPGAVMPEPIPRKALRAIKAEKGLSGEERFWSMAAVVVTVIAAILSYFLKCPMPMVLAFAFGAIAVALLEVEEN